MNKQLQDHARSLILEGLRKLPESWQQFFIKLYGKSTDTIEEAVSNMSEDKLDTALSQVERSLKKQNVKQEL